MAASREPFHVVLVVVFIFSGSFPFRLAASAAFRPGVVITPLFEDGIEEEAIGRFAESFVGLAGAKGWKVSVKTEV